MSKATVIEFEGDRIVERVVKRQDVLFSSSWLSHLSTDPSW
jgi:hypothetical protein